MGTCKLTNTVLLCAVPAQDVMAVRQTGWAMLCAHGVQVRGTHDYCLSPTPLSAQATSTAQQGALHGAARRESNSWHETQLDAVVCSAYLECML